MKLLLNFGIATLLLSPQIINANCPDGVPFRCHLALPGALHVHFKGTGGDPGIGLNTLPVKKPFIFPFPQEMVVTPDSFVVDESLAILIPEKSSEQDVSLARLLQKEMSDKYGVTVKIEKGNAIPGRGNVILMGTIKNSLVNDFCKKHKLEVSDKRPGKEGYVLTVKKNLIVIAGWDDAGAFYGLQSLRQLLIAGQGKFIQGVEITDWPNLPFRGIRLYIPGPENIPFFKRFISDFMALYKYNKVILEVISMRLDRHPEINAGWIEFCKHLKYNRLNSTEGPRGELKDSSHSDAGDGIIIEKDEVQDIVEYARKNFLEVIPEIPSLTHGYYLLAKHPELAEYPDDKWPDTYCPSNPESYKLMYDVYDEYIEVMRPEMVNIGHDEWWGAPLEVCPSCKSKGYSELFAEDVNKIYDYFSAKGIKIAMWGDYLLESVRGKGAQETTSSTGIKYKIPGALNPETVRKSIPKDILVLNWFWGDTDKEKELQDFGFKQVYGNFKPNMSSWEERIKQVDVIGGAPSSWAATNEYNFGKDLLLDFLGCANFLWSTHTINQPQLGELVRWELAPSVRNMLNRNIVPSQDGNPIVPQDISGYFNLSAGANLSGLKKDLIKTGNVSGKTMKFYLFPSDSSTQDWAVAVQSGKKGKGALPQCVDRIAINKDVSSLVFLHACATPGLNKKAYYNIPDSFDTADLLGWYEIIYEDGFKEIIPIQYGVNILEWNPGGEKSFDRGEGTTGSPQKAYCYEAVPIDCSADNKINPVTFFAFEWVNKRFGKKISAINLKSTGQYIRANGYLKASGGEFAPPNTIILKALNIIM